MKNLYRRLVLKLHKFLFKDVYENIPNEFKNFTILTAIVLWTKSSESKLEKLEFERKKFTNEYLKKMNEIDGVNKSLKINFERLSNRIDQHDIQINRLKNLKT